MKYRALFIPVILAALLAPACSSVENAPEEVQMAPKVEYSIEQESFEVAVDSTVMFGATIVEGLDVKAAWYVDDVKVANLPSLAWTFRTLGTVTVRFEASNSLGSVSKSYTVKVNGIPLEVEYSEPGNALPAIVGTPLEVSVTVVGGDKGTVHSWTLDGTEIGTGTGVSYNFVEDEVGTHTLVYNGINTDGLTATKTWTVTVTDLPLELSFSPEQSEVSAMEGDVVKFAATVVHGSKGLVYKWSVDDVEAGSEASFSYTCSAQGTFTVKLDAINAAGEKVSNSWTLTVTEKVALIYMYLDAETLAAVPSFVEANNVGGNPCVRIENNPCISEVNPGTKAFVDDMSAATWANSGYVKLLINSMPTADRAKFKTVRVKVYLGDNDYVPYMTITVGGDKASLPTKVNGTDFYPNSSHAIWNTLVKHDDWNVLEYSLVKGNYSGVASSLADCDQIQFRLNVVWGNGSAPVAVTPTNNHIIYFDDVEFLE